MNPKVLADVSQERLRRDLFHLCRDPFSFRTVSYTRPWQSKNSLDETDEFIAAEMRRYSSLVELVPNRVQAFRCNPAKPLHHWYDRPQPEDPWYDAHNIEVTLPGSGSSGEIIQLISHKDSMSWINSPGAHDNAVGTVANMELVRVLSALPRQRTVRVLFCNEEHTPWHSASAANAARERGDNIIAVLNQDSLDGKSDADFAANRKTHYAIYSTPEGQALAELMPRTAQRYQLPLEVFCAPKKSINDDDGNFIKAGYRRTIMNLGSYPYSDEQYHLPGDIPERVDLENLRLSTQLLLAAVLDIDEQGESIFAG